ncbi:hypothetical protein ACE5IS_10670 [Leptospira wolffii]|uniref:Uncharacterized protein n=1 Tax=Leptospira wolffii TaxID=409998 RepID=A0ABV5BTN6_9LEPT
MKSIKKMLRINFLLLLFLSSVAIYSESDEILKIREIYKRAQEFQKSDSSNSIQYVRYWDEDKKSLYNWERFDKNSQKETDILSFIRIFSKDGKVSSALMEEATPSGDWACTTEYYFYENSKIAFVYSILSTFYGNVRVEKRYYYNDSFRKIRDLKSIYDLQTNKKLKDRSNDFMDRKVIVAKDIITLFKLLQLNR